MIIKIHTCMKDTKWKLKKKKIMTGWKKKGNIIKKIL